MKPIAEGLHHRGRTSDDNGTLQTSSKVDITSLDAIGHQLMHTGVFEADERWLEEDLRCARLVRVADVDLGAVGQDIIIGVVLASSLILAALVRTVAVHMTIFAFLKLVGSK